MILSEIKNAKSKKFTIKSCLNQRLLDLGFLPGLKIKVQSKLNGDYLITVPGSGTFAVDKECVKDIEVV